jgi:hypothetical protein
MTCPSCSREQDVVIDSRHSPRHDCQRRRRKCLVCGFKWTTYELPELARGTPQRAERGVTRPERTRDYIAGYQAGYHAGQRKVEAA